MSDPILEMLQQEIVRRADRHCYPLLITLAGRIARAYWTRKKPEVITTDRELAEESGVSVRTIEYWKRSMERSGLIEIRQHGHATRFTMPDLVEKLKEHERQDAERINILVNERLKKALGLNTKAA